MWLLIENFDKWIEILSHTNVLPTVNLMKDDQHPIKVDFRMVVSCFLDISIIYYYEQKSCYCKLKMGTKGEKLYETQI
jgi:hypothetical protein